MVRAKLGTFIYATAVVLVVPDRCLYDQRDTDTVGISESRLIERLYRIYYFRSRRPLYAENGLNDK